ncbi:lectin BRA-2-like [Haliotis asinina]|uniref:lectin BRA-2-like n=1 Tax=Haliotis asinina TaxID=109174 RepID=UPI0035322275
MLQLIASFMAMNLLQQDLIPLSSSSPSLAFCAYTCLSDSSCSSFFYQRQHLRCYHSTLVYITTSSAMENVTGVVYYSWAHPECPSDYVFSRGAYLCVKIGGQTDWFVASDTCADRGERLVKIDTGSKQRQMAYMSSEVGEIWTGLHYTGSEFRWTDGSLMNYSSWYPGQPLVLPSFICVVLYDVVPRTWHNGYCTFPYYAACEVVL